MEPVVREVYMMLVMTSERRRDETGSRWQLENFMDEKSLAHPDSVKGRCGWRVSGSEWIGAKVGDVSELSRV